MTKHENPAASTADAVELPLANPALPPENDPDAFDWNDRDCVVLTEQYATAIYFNEVGELVIRQRRAIDVDQFIFINQDCAGTFIDKLTDAFGVPSFGGPEPTPPQVRKS